MGWGPRVGGIDSARYREALVATSGLLREKIRASHEGRTMRFLGSNGSGLGRTTTPARIPLPNFERED
jgi:hypothetical protein